MMTRERPRLNATEDGRFLRVDGDEHVYARDTRSWWLALRDVRIAQALREDLDAPVGMDEPLPMVHDLQVRCIAHLEAREKVTLAGWGDTTDKLPTTIRTHRENEERRQHGLKVWEAVVGFIPRDPEMRSSRDQWFLEIAMPRADLELLVAAIRTGEAVEFTIGVLATFHVINGEEHTPIGYPLERFLVPERCEFFDGWNMQAVRGQMRHVSWVQPEPKPVDLPPQVEPPPAPVDAGPDSSEILAHRVDALRVGVVRAGWIIAVAVLVAAVVP